MINATGKQSSAMEMSGPQELTQEIKETSSIHLGKSPDKAAGGRKRRQAGGQVSRGPVQLAGTALAGTVRECQTWSH